MSDFIHFLDVAFKDDNLSKLDVEILWRLKCGYGYAKTQKIIVGWTGSTQGAVAKSLIRLVEYGHLVKEGRAYKFPNVIIDEEEYSSGNKKYSSRKLKDSSGNNDTIYINNKNSRNDNTPTSTPKKPLREYPSILLTEPEGKKVVDAYKQFGLSASDGFERLAGYAEDHPGKFKKYKSHYRVLIGWVLESCLEAEKKKLDLERSRTYHQNATGGNEAKRPRPKERPTQPRVEPRQARLNKEKVMELTKSFWEKESA